MLSKATRYVVEWLFRSSKVTGRQPRDEANSTGKLVFRRIVEWVSDGSFDRVKSHKERGEKPSQEGDGKEKSADRRPCRRILTYFAKWFQSSKSRNV
ncbi:hypothetical protein H5410_003397 [Solanum commersonii]|uniref:Uncharacterized protein n=1 Tax=Solanum commersonii TaxID=4109 RepID=A0A9J6B4W7_SOLCO|nr:hypothetical protein H5410_003397 [Solanum commersonii]